MIVCKNALGHRSARVVPTLEHGDCQAIERVPGTHDDTSWPRLNINRLLADPGIPGILRYGTGYT